MNIIETAKAARIARESIAAPDMAEALRIINLILLPDSPGGQPTAASIKRARELAHAALAKAGL